MSFRFLSRIVASTVADLVLSASIPGGGTQDLRDEAFDRTCRLNRPFELRQVAGTLDPPDTNGIEAACHLSRGRRGERRDRRLSTTARAL